MTENRRIFWNIVATYGRSLYALVIGLFCGRWTLMALGEIDYGLMGVIGGLAAFVSFINGIMAAGVSRFYAVSVGEARNDSVKGLEKCREWFTTAVVLHSFLSAVLVLIGYPVGSWAIEHFLTIPPERIQASLWVWRFTCVSCFVGMATVPYQAMYVAKQEIAELTAYSFVTTTLNVLFLYYMVNHPGDWLAKFSLWTCCLGVLSPLVISARSFIKYDECRIRIKYLNCISRIKRMLSYAGWFCIGNLAALLRNQGISVLVNKYFGPGVNAAQAIGNVVSGQCMSLSGSLIGAVSPAIATAYGARDFKKMETLVYRVSKIAPSLTLMFAIPFSLEVDKVLRLWLKHPPEFSAGLCIAALLASVIDTSSYGYAVAAHACEKIANYQGWVGGINLISLPLALIVASMGFNVYWIAGVVVFMNLMVASVRVKKATKMLPLSGKYWLHKILIPIGTVAMVASSVGSIPNIVMPSSFFRIIVTTICSELVFLPGVWFIVLSHDERKFVLDKVRRLYAGQN